MTGFYFAHRLTDEIGLLFAVVYIPEEREHNRKDFGKGKRNGNISA